MSAYFVARLRITNPARYNDYLEGTDDALAGTGGEVIAVDDATVTLEGNAPPGRSVIIRFSDEAALRAWYESPAYRRLKTIRDEAAEGVAIIVHGLS
ncbi:MAG: DUF1330 domain-containing protein [Spirochaetaceae bacterium]|nr:DUF1330 domain-containing protein [Spirochaetaceae bacterium]